MTLPYIYYIILPIALEEYESRFLDTDFDVARIHPEILPAVIALRNAGVETIASHSGIGQIGVEDAWGSYIQIRLFYEGGFETAKKISKFAGNLTTKLRKDLGNDNLTLQVVSAAAWYEDINNASMETNIPIYRMQLVGQTTDDEIRYAWENVAQEFSPDVIK